MYYFPIMSLTPVYFDRHRGFAMGVILAGSGIGGLVIAPVLQVLLDKYGVQWALRVLGIWNLVVGIPVSCVVRHRPGFGFHARSNGGSVTRNRTRMNMGLVKRGTFLYQVCHRTAISNIVAMSDSHAHSIGPRRVPSGRGKRHSHVLLDLLLRLCPIVHANDGKYPSSYQ